MRVELASHSGVFKTYRATLSAYGKQKVWDLRGRKTILLKNVEHVLSGQKVTDHIWFTDFKGKIVYPVNTVVEFEGLVGPYLKGNEFKKIDYSFVEIQNVKRVHS